MCMENFVKIELCLFIQILYVAWKIFERVPRSSQNFMHLKVHMHL